MVVGVIVFVLVRIFVRVIVALATASVDAVPDSSIVPSEIGVMVSVFSTLSVWVAFCNEREALWSGVLLILKGKLKPGIHPLKPIIKTRAERLAIAIQTHFFENNFFPVCVSPE